MAARGVNIRELLLDELSPDKREQFSDWPGGPCISGELRPSGLPDAHERLAEPCVVFTIQSILGANEAAVPA